MKNKIALVAIAILVIFSTYLLKSKVLKVDLIPNFHTPVLHDLFYEE